ncbi:MAG TPA: hypothetical protein VFF88_09000 [Methylocella sp.]|nr:hypothetical protein [Methylocella sp.]
MQHQTGRPRRIKWLVTGLLACLLTAGASRSSHAGDSYNPAESAVPLPAAPGAQRQPLSRREGGYGHTNAFGKPCLQYQFSPQRHITNPAVADYVISITNSCPQPIRVELCPKGSYDCTKVSLRIYQRRDVVMGSGPFTDAFPYTARELP